jgi:hypothetical protein
MLLRGHWHHVLAVAVAALLFDCPPGTILSLGYLLLLDALGAAAVLIAAQAQS